MLKKGVVVVEVVVDVDEDVDVDVEIDMRDGLGCDNVCCIMKFRNE